jgi:predicted RNA-binding Zn ribbon-like protein
MTPSTDPLAVAFANTRSSPGRDRIAAHEQFNRWAQAWPAFSGLLSCLDVTALREIHAQRDATQLVLHDLAQASTPSAELLDCATRPGLAAASFHLRPTSPGQITACHHEAAAAAVLHLLSRALVDFLISPQATQLRRCQGTSCHKVFIGQRPDRRWCDSRVCGNRARVATHARLSAERRKHGDDGDSR